MRTAEQRTKEELAKSLGDIFEFLNFTTESANDFTDNYLPTLDVKIKIKEGGEITFRHFYKPMINNLLLQNGTALSKNTVFSSLRQDLVRRLLNTCVSEGMDQRLAVIEEYIQLLVNSGHRFSFIKSICLQAITKYEYMLGRNNLDPSDDKYQPLYCERNFKEVCRPEWRSAGECAGTLGEDLRSALSAAGAWVGEFGMQS